MQFMFPLCMLLTFICEADGVETGWWSQYAEQPTIDMIWYHGYEDEDVDGFIAVLDCGRVGEYAWIGINSGIYYVRAFDCLGGWDGGDPVWWYENNLIGEIDYYLAEREGVVGQGGVRAWIIWED